MSHLRGTLYQLNNKIWLVVKALNGKISSQRFLFRETSKYKAEIEKMLFANTT